MTYTAHVLTFTLKHACVQATWYNTHLNEDIRVGIGFIIHIYANGSYENIRAHKKNTGSTQTCSRVR